MDSFEYHRPSTQKQASLLLTSSPRAHVVSGNTDLLGEMKQGLVHPESLVSLADVEGMKVFHINGNESKLGSMVTLSDIVDSKYLKVNFPALVEAAASVATPQIRSIGTLGGNLCQRPRCWYYRSPLFDCLKKGGNKCFAVGGLDKYHSIIGGEKCWIVHPSDIAVALTALDAKVKIFGPSGYKNMKIDDFFVGPGIDIHNENVLKEGEFVSSIEISCDDKSSSTFLKFKERQSMDFALASAAVSISLAEGKIHRAGVALGGIAPIPWRLQEIEEYMMGIPIDDLRCSDEFSAKVESSLGDAKPMSENNAYKIDLAISHLKRALDKVIQDLC
ncbi:MAG: xanthine dehydrogenase family protein subunit M [SAR202 cluster bacterium]|nr:MAG: xanthine dehydrogenase family protein subunit M [SAR202 cluster bacterium]MQG74593.1 xanthine dehydrogenase family protein subunit M [SAR202 cluster bacterium]